MGSVSAVVYKELLLDHYRSQRYRGKVDAPTFTGQEYNPSCGDRIAFEGVVKDGIIEKLAFSGHGCVISQAVASLLAQSCCLQPVPDVMLMDAEKIIQMIGMPLGPTRLKCALLPLHALKNGLAAAQKDQPQP
jgi:nitrogen fixation NifU-like protein